MYKTYPSDGDCEDANSANSIQLPDFLVIFLLLKSDDFY